ncbi:MAG: cupin domain-containing protein [Elusimicrobiota bacterium]|nr:MAG: cupin domain-containing protein [Elusimicrobiota bacterium]
MKLFRRKPAFTDARGAITDILDGVPLNAVTIITNKKGAVRANHYHKKTVQYTYVLSGRVKYVSKGKGRATSAILRPGDLAVSPPTEWHATEALTDATFLALAHGLRHGRDYEKDTFRLAEPLIKPKKARK